MRVLLVNPAFPVTYWSLDHMLPFVGKSWLVPPLSLITLAALLPQHWEFRLIDLEVEPLRDQDILAADVVMLSGMLVQRESLHEILARCKRLNVPTVVGGPYATSTPDELPEATHLFLGEAEGRIDEFAADLEAGRARRLYREDGKPDLATSPVPRFDLLRPDAYHYWALQYSRGCPFTCEFCDITVLYGRRPRTKSAEQVIAELEAIRGAGFSGRVMFVDDNFIGDKKAVKRFLPELAAWRNRTRAPLDFFTEASIDLAEDPELVSAMTAAGFAVVFIGIESPSKESLLETRKNQNLRRDMIEQLRSLRSLGLDVWGGFILGFDHDGPDIFERMIEFVERSGIAYATVGMLMALPNTPLYKRLEREGRLRPDPPTGDNLAFSNVVMKLPAPQMIEGYLHVVETLYEPERYFARCREHLRYWQPPGGLTVPISARDLLVVARSIWVQGVRGPYRRAYWRFLAWVLRKHPGKIALAFAQACAGHHFITYTRETVAANLRKQLALLEEFPAPEQRPLLLAREPRGPEPRAAEAVLRESDVA